MQRYEELVTLRVTDRERIKTRLQQQERVILAIDGLQPDVGHEVLWVVRDLSGCSRSSLAPVKFAIQRYTCCAVASSAPRVLTIGARQTL